MAYTETESRNVRGPVLFDACRLFHRDQVYCCDSTHTHVRLTAFCPGLPGWDGTRKVKSIWIFTEARDSEWQRHQLGHRPMQVCTSLKTYNHASTPPLSFLQAGCPSCRLTNSVKALEANSCNSNYCIFVNSTIFFVDVVVVSLTISNLSLLFISEFKFDGFSADTCRSLVATKDVSFVFVNG